jgi:regulator of RNase E activity RraA
VQAVLPTHLTDRLQAIEVSALCDADKTLPVADPAIRAMVPGVRFAGAALTVTAEDDHLPTFAALADAQPGEVLVIATNGGRLAVLGELFATEARRRGLAGVVIDGYCRDVHGLRALGFPVFARGTIPASGTTVSRAPLRAPIRFGGLDVADGDVVFADDDGIVIAPAAQVSAALGLAETIGRLERAMLAAMARGEVLHDQTNFAEHVAALDAGERSALGFTIDVDAS